LSRKKLEFSSRRRVRVAALSLLSLLVFSFMTISQPVYDVFAVDGLGVNSNARVAGTDGDGINLREEPNSKGKVIKVVGENELVVIKGAAVKDKQGNSFYKVEYDGKTGYMMSQYLYFAGKPAPNTPNFKVGSNLKIAGTDGDGVNMRQQATGASAVLDILDEGLVVSVLGGPFTDKSGNNFYRVSADGKTGFVTMSYLSLAPKGTTNSQATPGFMRITNTDGDPVRFRSEPNRSGSVKAAVYEGDVLKVLGGAVKDSAGNSWYKLERNGVTGYVDATFLSRSNGPARLTEQKPAPAPAAPAPAPAPARKPAVQAPATNGALGERVTTYARQFLGWRYIWAGSGPEDGGFDCSGFVMHVYGKFGYSVPHSTDYLVNVGKAVPASDLQPGDILIWSNTYKPGPSHTGIYIGGGKFIHAENESSGVTIDNLSNPYYAARYTTARRVGV
jgi:peptidoglycan DL-endopeptidase LytF